MKTTGNSRPFAAWRVISVAAYPRRPVRVLVGHSASLSSSGRGVVGLRSSYRVVTERSSSRFATASSPSSEPSASIAR
jgi:hypothetical protein